MTSRAILIRVLILAALLSVPVVGLTNAQEPEPQGEPGIQAALGTTFTYQGRLLDGGTPADGPMISSSGSTTRPAWAARWVACSR
jgi:hypothetical protein